MLRIKRGESLYEIREYGDRTEVDIYRVYPFSTSIPAEYVRTVVIPKSEYRGRK